MTDFYSTTTTGVGGNIIITNQGADSNNKPSLPMHLIPEPFDTDVVGGRGGAAHRHPGNQVYRKIVQVNKGLYATCVKAEKLKISRSIVETIRENGGRFLEFDKKTKTWFDIGDKKAMAKTSQALREGLPKIRKQIAAKGGGAAGVKGLLEEEYARMKNGQQGESKKADTAAPSSPKGRPKNEDVPSSKKPRSPKASDNGTSSSGASFGQRFPSGLTLPGESSSAGFDLDTITEDPKAPLHPSFTTRGTTIHTDLGIDPLSTLSLQSEFSQLSDRSQLARASARGKGSSLLGSMSQHNSAESSATFDFSLPSYDEDPEDGMEEEGADDDQVDRRNLFARMKFRRAPSDGRRAAGQASGKSAGSGDGMPSIYSVDSNDGSHFSNMSSVMLNIEENSTASDPQQQQKQHEDVEHIFESRLSLMSGISLLASNGSLLSRADGTRQLYSV